MFITHPSNLQGALSIYLRTIAEISVNHTTVMAHALSKSLELFRLPHSIVIRTSLDMEFSLKCDKDLSPHLPDPATPG